MLELNKIHLMDCLKGLKQMPSKSVNCCITSPPYFNLRDYGVDGQIGLENTPKEFIKKLVKVFRELKRVLADDGTLWLNIGDSYAAPAKNRTDNAAAKNSTLSGSKGTQSQILKQKSKIVDGLKPKDLIGIPWMLAFALRADGWYLRQDIIWSKPNAMPESVTDRCTKSHEYIFMLSKSNKYYYDSDAIKTEPKYVGLKGMTETGFKDAKTYNGKHSDKQRGHSQRHAGFNKRWDNMTVKEQMSLKANKRSVWNVATKPYKEAHFATFPPKLIIDCVKAGCPENGVIIDPFMGAGTTAIVASKLNRQFIGFELNPKYIAIAEKRIISEMGLFKI